MGVSPVTTFAWGNEDEKAEMEALARRTKAAEGRQILAQVTVRNGYSPEMDISLRTFPLVLPLPPKWLED